MTKEDRQAAIRKVLEEEPFVTVAELATRFNTSESTIRRDLAEMAQQGVIKRTHGGAVSQIAAPEEPTPPEERKPEVSAEPSKIQGEELSRMAIAASRLVNEGETIIIDSGPGTLLLARRIKASRRNLTVLTNNLEVALELSESFGVSAILTGGLVRGLRSGLVGYVAEQTLRGMQVDKLFLTAPGIDQERGLTTSQLEEITVKQAMIQAAREVILLAQHNQFGKVALVSFAPLTAVHKVVTGRELPPEMISAIARLGIETILA
ncbi:MAG: DeoR/GlpR family DNA-binding transcription regulator [Anaerolineae bacterium]|nr:DeoR/GlpR family DNA-binding transcription regulator [Anaerolineae bacterium]